MRKKKRKYHSRFHDPAPEKYARLKASNSARLPPWRWAIMLAILLVPLFFLIDCSFPRSVEVTGVLQAKQYVLPPISDEGPTYPAYMFKVDGKKAWVTKREFEEHQVGDVVTVRVRRGRFTGMQYAIERRE